MNQLADEILKRLDAVGGKVLDGGKYAFEQLARVQVADALTNIIAFTVAILAVVIVMKIWLGFLESRKATAPRNYVSYSCRMSPEQLDFAKLPVKIVGSVLIALFFASALSEIPRLVMPQAYAVRDLMQSIGR